MKTKWVLNKKASLFSTKFREREREGMQADNLSPLFTGITVYSSVEEHILGDVSYKTSAFDNYSYWNWFKFFIKYDPAPLPGLLGNRLWSWINRKILGRLPLQFSNLLTHHLHPAPPAWHISALTGLGWDQGHVCLEQTRDTRPVVVPLAIDLACRAVKPHSQVGQGWRRVSPSSPPAPRQIPVPLIPLGAHSSFPSRLKYPNRRIWEQWHILSVSS